MLNWDNLSAGDWSRQESLQNQGAGHSKTHACDNGKQEWNTAGSFILDSNDWHPHLFLMNKTCAPKIMMSKACHAVKTLPPKAAQAAGNTEGQGNWPLFLKTKSDHTCREKGWFKKTLVLFFCPAQSTNPSSQAPSVGLPIPTWPHDLYFCHYQLKACLLWPSFLLDQTWIGLLWVVFLRKPQPWVLSLTCLFQF